MIRSIVLIAIFGASFAFADVPHWFGDTSKFPVKDQYQYVEFASGKTYEEAMINARNAIAASMQVRITSESQITESVIESEFKEEFHNFQKTQVDVVLDSPVTILQSEDIDGVFWIAAMYDNTPTQLRLERLAKPEYCHNKQFDYFSEFEKLLHIDGNKCLPRFSLDANIGHWQLLFPDRKISLDEKMLNNLFHSHQDKSISVKITPNRLKPYEPYFINITAHSKGYLSLIQLYQNGQSAVLLENQYINQAQQFTFPDKEKYDGLINVLDEDVEQNRDLTLALLCRVQLDLTKYSFINNSEIDNYQYVSADKLLRHQDCQLATDVLVTRQENEPL